MAGSKSTQTRFVGIITSNIHPYACFSHLPCTYSVYSCRFVRAKFSVLDLDVGEMLSPVTDGSESSSPF